LAVGLVAAGCADRPRTATPPSPSPSAGSDGLRPLTSRDAEAPFRAPDPATDALPPGHPPIDGAAGGASAAPAAASHERALTGTVAVAPALAARLNPADVLYIIARNHKTQAVVAVRRDEGVRFPHSFELGAQHVMVQGQAFAGPFDVVARVSRSGDAIAAPGDLEGLVSEVAAGSQRVAILVDRVRQ
jgi:cytochrome c-type biogenesis protein CcmH